MYVCIVGFNVPLDLEHPATEVLLSEAKTSCSSGELRSRSSTASVSSSVAISVCS